MNEYVPSLAQMRRSHDGQWDIYSPHGKEAAAEFDRWVAAHDRAVVAAAMEDISFVWDWQINRGVPFIPESLVPVMRALVAGEALEAQPGWEWVAEARKDDEHWERHGSEAHAEAELGLRG